MIPPSLTMQWFLTIAHRVSDSDFRVRCRSLEEVRTFLAEGRLIPTTDYEGRVRRANTTMCRSRKCTCHCCDDGTECAAACSSKKAWELRKFCFQLVVSKLEDGNPSVALSAQRCLWVFCVCVLPSVLEQKGSEVEDASDFVRLFFATFSKMLQKGDLSIERSLHGLQCLIFVQHFALWFCSREGERTPQLSPGNLAVIEKFLVNSLSVPAVFGRTFAQRMLDRREEVKEQIRAQRVEETMPEAIRKDEGSTAASTQSKEEELTATHFSTAELEYGCLSRMFEAPQSVLRQRTLRVALVLGTCSPYFSQFRSDCFKFFSSLQHDEDERVKVDSFIALRAFGSPARIDRPMGSAFFGPLLVPRPLIPLPVISDDSFWTLELFEGLRHGELATRHAAVVTCGKIVACLLREFCLGSFDIDPSSDQKLTPAETEQLRHRIRWIFVVLLKHAMSVGRDRPAVYVALKFLWWEVNCWGSYAAGRLRQMQSDQRRHIFSYIVRGERSSRRKEFLGGKETAMKCMSQMLVRANAVSQDLLQVVHVEKEQNSIYPDLVAVLSSIQTISSSYARELHEQVAAIGGAAICPSEETPAKTRAPKFLEPYCWPSLPVEEPVGTAETPAILTSLHALLHEGTVPSAKTSTTSIKATENAADRSALPPSLFECLTKVKDLLLLATKDSASSSSLTSHEQIQRNLFLLSAQTRYTMNECSFILRRASPLSSSSQGKNTACRSDMLKLIVPKLLKAILTDLSDPRNYSILSASSVWQQKAVTSTRGDQEAESTTKTSEKFDDEEQHSDENVHKKRRSECIISIPSFEEVKKVFASVHASNVLRWSDLSLLQEVKEWWSFSVPQSVIKFRSIVGPCGEWGNLETLFDARGNHIGWQTNARSAVGRLDLSQYAFLLLPTTAEPEIPKTILTKYELPLNWSTCGSAVEIKCDCTSSSTTTSNVVETAWMIPLTQRRVREIHWLSPGDVALSVSLVIPSAVLTNERDYRLVMGKKSRRKNGRANHSREMNSRSRHTDDGTTFSEEWCVVSETLRTESAHLQ